MRAETAVAGREVRDVGQQRLAADLGPGGSTGRRFGCAGQDGSVQVAVAVNQTAVAAGRAGDRGDGALLTVGGELVEGLEDLSPAAFGVRSPCLGQVVR